MRLLPAIAILLLPVPGVAGDVVSAAVSFSRSEASLPVSGGGEVDIEMRRTGIELWEPLRGDVQIGIALGISESERRGAVDASARGNFGVLAIRYQPWFGDNVGLLAQGSWGLQDDDYETDFAEGKIRIYETRALLAPQFRAGPFRLAAGASWRRLEYRERDGVGLLVDLEESTAVRSFASLGLVTEDNGLLRLEWFENEASGWRIQFEKGF